MSKIVRSLFCYKALLIVSTNYNHYKDGSAFCTEGKKKY